MSRYAWQEGTILLPTKEVARVKKAVRDATNREHDRVYAAMKDWWRANGRKVRAGKDQYELPDLPGERRTGWAEYGNDGMRATFWNAQDAGRLTRAEVRPARATARTATFTAGHEGTITFKGREVTWSVEENNHAPERANADPVAKAFFQALDRVEWTRGSGGVIVGNDEYNRDSREGGGGGNYEVKGYGPKGGREVGRAQRGSRGLRLRSFP